MSSNLRSFAVLLLILAACPTAQTQGQVALGLQVVATGFTQPVHLTAPPGDQRLFVVEQLGRVRVIKDGQTLQRSFLNIFEQVRCCGERGLFAVAFHPEYASNGRFFVHYTDLNGDTVLSEFYVSANPDLADPTSERILLQVDQPHSNHNGGQIAFGPDGYLYLGLGDGGGQGDPMGNGQNLDTLLGKILRLDVDSAQPYGIPADNPFVDRPGRDELWAWGLRNPWRFSFDRETGELWIADVGQNRYEEIDLGVAGGNYGWNIMEGNHCYLQASCDPSGLITPVLEYGRNVGQAITGGFVYRGRELTGWQGAYFYADYGSGLVRSFRYQDGAVTDQVNHTSTLGGFNISSFGEDAQGELYLLSYEEGTVYRIVER